MSGVGPRSPSAGAGLALGAVAAAVAALPDVKRVAEAGVSPGLAWLGLAGSTALVLGPLLVLGRAAATRMRTSGAALLGIGLAALPLALLGQMLKAHTHHRPLGAATFGALALGIVVGCWLVGVRLHAWASEQSSPLRRILPRFAAAVAISGTAVAIVRAVASESAHHHVIDVLRVLAATALAWMALKQPRVEMWARRAGPLAWLVLVVLGLVAAAGPARAAIREHAPVLGGPAAWL